MSIISCIMYSYLNLLPYWRNNKIHNLGNTGPLGNLHAATAPLMTKFIDKKAYGGRNVREEVYNTFEGDVLDMCCGTGFSTVPTVMRASTARRSVGIDTSPEMLRFAGLFNPDSAYKWGNAETFGDDEEFDTVSIMFSLHEMPRDAYRNVIRNAIRVARNRVVIVDISSDYKPSRRMLSGEPYLADYLKKFDYNIVNTVVWKEETNTHFPIFHIPKWNKTNLVKGHVDMWEYTKPPKYSITDCPLWADNIYTDRHKQRQLLIRERRWKALERPKGEEKELANERRKRAWDYFMGGDDPADTVFEPQYLQKNVELYRLRNGIKLSTHATANYIREEKAANLRKAMTQVDMLVGGYDEFYNEKYIHPLRIAREENEKNAETLDLEHAPEPAPDPDPDPDPDPGEAAVFIIDFTDSSALTLVDWDKIVAILFATSVGSLSALFILVLNFIYDKSTGMVVAVTWMFPLAFCHWLIYIGHIA